MARTIIGHIRWVLNGLAVTAVLLAPGGASGDVSFAPVTWGDGGSLEGWVNQGGDAVSVTALATGGSRDGRGFLAIDFPPTQPMGLQANAVANSGAGYTGYYLDPSLGLRFDLMGYPGSIQAIYFTSSVGGGSTWQWDLFVADEAGHGWRTYLVNFQQQLEFDSVGWYRTAGTVDLLTALSYVDSIGLIVSHYGPPVPVAMQYGLDNWQFFVPEPDVTAMAAILILSAAFWGWRAFHARGA